jgi:hypothetical protein
VLIEMLTAAIVGEPADPISIHADRGWRDATVALPHTPDLGKPLWIAPPSLHRRHPHLGGLMIRTRNGAGGMTKTLGGGWDIIWSEVAAKPAQCMRIPTLLQIKRDSGQWI